jgi:hypothetical protein
MIDQEILDYLNGVYALLQSSDRLEADEVLGLIAEAKAVWENDLSSFDIGGSK